MMAKLLKIVCDHRHFFFFLFLKKQNKKKMGGYIPLNKIFLLRKWKGQSEKCVCFAFFSTTRAVDWVPDGCRLSGRGAAASAAS